ncbi:TPA: hypothetical protein ACX6NV_000559 [Photobacterium damselae]
MTSLAKQIKMILSHNPKANAIEVQQQLWEKHERSETVHSIEFTMTQLEIFAHV